MRLKGLTCNVPSISLSVRLLLARESLFSPQAGRRRGARKENLELDQVLAPKKGCPVQPASSAYCSSLTVCSDRLGCGY